MLACGIADASWVERSALSSALLAKNNASWLLHATMGILAAGGVARLKRGAVRLLLRRVLSGCTALYPISSTGFQRLQVKHVALEVQVQA